MESSISPLHIETQRDALGYFIAAPLGLRTMVGVSSRLLTWYDYALGCAKIGGEVTPWNLLFRPYRAFDFLVYKPSAMRWAILLPPRWGYVK